MPVFPDTPAGGGQLQRTGIGPALKQARLLQGKSIEEASRDTRIRPEYIDALEGERYESLIGEPYVRGFLRSYSTYLGLDPDKVVTVYNRSFGPPRPTLPDPAPGPSRTRRSAPPHLVDVVRHHPSWTFLIAVAVLALVVFGAFGLLSRSPAVPRADKPSARPSVTVLPPSVVVTLTAQRDVDAEILVDGKRDPASGAIRRGQGLSFEGANRIVVRLAEGGSVKISVNGHSLGTPGQVGVPWQRSFGPQDFRRSPSETPSPSP
jgi:cytoskeletal protein RodZ